jgi:plasmid stabilization system protein ParE
VKRPAILLLPQAEVEIQEAMHWYLERSALAANAFKAELIEAIDSLADHPERWPANEEGVRQRILSECDISLRGLDHGEKAAVRRPRRLLGGGEGIVGGGHR